MVGRLETIEKGGRSCGFVLLYFFLGYESVVVFGDNFLELGIGEKVG